MFNSFIETQSLADTLSAIPYILDGPFSINIDFRDLKGGFEKITDSYNVKKFKDWIKTADDGAIASIVVNLDNNPLFRPDAYSPFSGICIKNKESNIISFILIGSGETVHNSGSTISQMFSMAYGLYDHSFITEEVFY